MKYVQDRIAAYADDVWQLLGHPSKNTHVLVCGDASRMAPAVGAVFREIYSARTGADDAAKREWLEALVASEHYVEDVWAR